MNYLVSSMGFNAVLFYELMKREMVVSILGNVMNVDMYVQMHFYENIATYLIQIK